MTDRSQLQADIAAREEALDAGRSFIVQAPAGSGKTELLIQRYLSLLHTVDHPEEVLAITFTNKAAAEMRLRVVDALQKADAGVEPEAAHDRLTYRLAQAVLRRNSELSWGIEANTSRLRIQTLDSLNAYIAGMQPLTTSVATVGNSIPGEAQLEALYAEAAAATLDYLADEGLLKEAATSVLSHLDNNAGLYIRYLAAMLKTRDQWLPLIGGGLFEVGNARAARNELEGVLRGIVEDALAEVRERLPREFDAELLSILQFAGGKLRKSGSSSGLIELADCSALPGTDAGSAPLWDAISRCLLKPDGSLYSRVDKRHGFPADSTEDKATKKRYYELAADLHALRGFPDALLAVRGLPAAAYTDDQWSVLTALLNLLRLATVELRTLFRKRGALDYIEVAMNADQALGSPDQPGDASLIFDYRLRHVLVDEMQDTSIAQYRLLEALTGGWESGDGRTLFCVGDPMQSIYRFRNAEVAQFLVAKERGLGDIPLRSLVLQRNFRSGSTLVDWFNAVFPAVFAAQDDVDEGAISYSPAVAADHLQGLGEVHVHPLLGSDEGAEAERSCDILRDLLDSDPQGSIALLVRSRGQLRELIPRLRELDIDFRAVDIDRLTDLPEIIDVLALTRALSHCGDRHAWLAVLRAPWVGLNWQDLYALVRNDGNSSVLSLLRDTRRLDELSPQGRRAIERIMPLFDRAMSGERSQSLRSRVETLWMQLGGPVSLSDGRVVENVYRFFEVLSGLEQSGTLLDVAQLETQLDKEKVSTVSDARLQIMTMHKSKGLQFDHVVLHGLGRRPAATTAKVLHWMDSPSSTGREQRILAPVGRRDIVEKDSIHQYIAERNKRKEHYEKQRLLYVACTRAKKSLHLVGHTNVDEESGELKPPEAASLLNLVWPALRPGFQAAVDDGQSAVSGEHKVEWLLPRLRRLDPSWQPPRPSRLPGVVKQTATDETPVEFYWAGAEAKLAGTLVHRWLQLAAQRAGQTDSLDAARRRASGSRWLAEQGIRSGASREILARVEKAITAVAEDERGAWLLSGDGFAELALTGVIDGIVQTGIIDRVRIDGDTHWLVDYKTSSHEGGDLEYFLSEERRRYRDQLRVYAELYAAWSGIRPQCALYFPLLQAFVEVSLET